MVGYKTTKANEYLVITGAGIDGIRVCKKAFVKPWQRISRISISPYHIYHNSCPRTIEKLEFNLDAIFTVGPDDNTESLKKYAVLLSGNEKNSSSEDMYVYRAGSVKHIVQGIIEGEVDAVSSHMTIEEIFKEREIFKEEVIDRIQKELQKFGLRIYNFNIRDISDKDGFDYLTCMSKKIHEAATNQAKIDAAEAQMRGEIGTAKMDGMKKQELSRIEAETALLESERKARKAKADSELARCQMELDASLELANMTAQRQSEMKDSELQKEVESRRAEAELERLRASDVVKSKVARESAQEKADSFLYKEQKEADAVLYKEKIEADALFYRQKREAEGMLEIAKAYGALVDVLGGPQGFLQYKMLESGTYEKLAEANGLAINGLQPKITMWNTGSGDASSDSASPIRSLLQNIPPLLSTIHDQTGIAPPSWSAQMPSHGTQEANGTKAINGKGTLLAPNGA